MPSLSLLRRCAPAAIAAAAIALAVPAAAQPDFAGGSSYATTTLNTNGSVTGTGSGRVRVWTELGPTAGCLDDVDVETGPDYYSNPGLNPLEAAPVLVTVAPVECGGVQSPGEVIFFVQHPGTSSVLGVTIQDTSGRTLHRERIPIEPKEDIDIQD